MLWNTDDVTALLDAFQRALHAEDASRHTTSAYRADLHHFLTWLVQTTDACRLQRSSYELSHFKLFSLKISVVIGSFLPFATVDERFSASVRNEERLRRVKTVRFFRLLPAEHPSSERRGKSLSRISSPSFGAINEQLYRLGDRASLSTDLSGAQCGDFWGREEPYRTHPHDECKELSRTPAI